MSNSTSHRLITEDDIRQMFRQMAKMSADGPDDDNEDIKPMPSEE